MYVCMYVYIYIYIYMYTSRGGTKADPGRLALLRGRQKAVEFFCRLEKAHRVGRTRSVGKLIDWNL